MNDNPQNTYRSTGEIVQAVVRDFGDVVRAEVRLARAELSEKAGRAGKAAGSLGAAAVTGLLGGMCLVATCIAGLATAMPLWLASFIMTVALLIAAGSLYAVGRSKLREVNPTPERTVQSVKDDIEWAKHHAR